MVRTRLNIGCRYSTPVLERPLHPTRSQFKPQPSQTQAPVTPATEPERRAGGGLTTSSFMVAIRLKKPASTVTHQTHLGNQGYKTSQENPHDQMTRITYRLRTEPIYRTIKIIPMSQHSLHTHIPECNSSMTHNQILCRSNQPHPSLTSTLTHCSISLLQEKPASLHQPQCTKNQDFNLHSLTNCPILRDHLTPRPTPQISHQYVLIMFYSCSPRNTQLQNLLSSPKSNT